jgi:hypothetical protein
VPLQQGQSSPLRRKGREEKREEKGRREAKRRKRRRKVKRGKRLRERSGLTTTRSRPERWLSSAGNFRLFLEPQTNRPRIARVDEVLVVSRVLGMLNFKFLCYVPESFMANPDSWALRYWMSACLLFLITRLFHVNPFQDGQQNTGHYPVRAILLVTRSVFIAQSEIIEGGLNIWMIRGNNDPDIVLVDLDWLYGCFCGSVPLASAGTVRFGGPSAFCTPVGSAPRAARFGGESQNTKVGWKLIELQLPHYFFPG